MIIAGVFDVSFGSRHLFYDWMKVAACRPVERANQGVRARRVRWLVLGWAEPGLGRPGLEGRGSARPLWRAARGPRPRDRPRRPSPADYLKPKYCQIDFSPFARETLPLALEHAQR